MELQLAPADVDAAAIEKEIGVQKDIVDGILAAYQQESIDGLEMHRSGARRSARVGNGVRYIRNRCQNLVRGHDRAVICKGRSQAIGKRHEGS